MIQTMSLNISQKAELHHNEITMKIDELTKLISSSMIKGSDNKTKSNPPIESEPLQISENLDVEEGIDLLLKDCKSPAQVTHTFPEISYYPEDDLYLCNICQSVSESASNSIGAFKFNVIEGDQRQFRNFKSHIKRHLKGSTHKRI